MEREEKDFIFNPTRSKRVVGKHLSHHRARHTHRPEYEGAVPRGFGEGVFNEEIARRAS